MNILAEPKFPPLTIGSDRLPRIGETIRVRRKSRSLMLALAEKLIREPWLMEPSRVTSGRERSTE